MTKERRFCARALDTWGQIPALAVAALAAAAAVAAGGCSGGETRYAAGPTRSCLEQNSSDVVTGAAARLTVALASGSIASLTFMRTSDEAAEIERAFAGRSRKAFGWSRRRQNVLVQWRHAPSAEDERGVDDCLRSQSGETTPGAAPLPAHPLGCVKAYLDAGATPTAIAAVRERLESDARVKSFTFTSANEALQRLKAKFPELVKRLPYNPLPAAFEIQPNRGRNAPAVAAALRGTGAALDQVQLGADPCP